MSNVNYHVWSGYQFGTRQDFATFADAFAVWDELSAAGDSPRLFGANYDGESDGLKESEREAMGWVNG